MVCIYCASKTKIVNSRGSAKTASTWRRRECLSCSSIFTTREKPDLEGALRVKSSSGALEPFLRDKLFLSVSLAVSHRKTALGDATELTDTVCKQALLLQKNGVIEKGPLTATVRGILNNFDKAAGVYYTAHYC